MRTGIFNHMWLGGPVHSVGPVDSLALREEGCAGAVRHILKPGQYAVLGVRSVALRAGWIKWVRGKDAALRTLATFAKMGCSDLIFYDCGHTVTKRKKENRGGDWFSTSAIPRIFIFFLLRNDRGAAQRRRGSRPLSEHPGRWFLLRWQVQTPASERCTPKGETC